MAEAADTSLDTLSQHETALVKVEPNWIKNQEGQGPNWACESCNQVFTTYESLLVHVGVTSWKPPLIFPPGELKSFSYLDLKRPKLSPSSIRKSTCSKKIRLAYNSSEGSGLEKTYNETKSHIPEVSSSLPTVKQKSGQFGKSRFKCGICETIFGSVKLLFSHFIHAHELKSLKITRFKCGTCGKLFEDLYSLSYHVEEFHKTRDTTSSQDSRRTPAPASPTVPSPTPTPESQRGDSPDRKVAFDCKICGRQLARLPELYDHLDACHRAGRSVRKSGFVQVRERKRSAEVVIEGEPQPNPTDSLTQTFWEQHGKSVTCLICRAVCRTTVLLLWHLNRVHTGRDRHQCPLCVDEFTTKPSLSTHLKTSHPEFGKHVPTKPVPVKYAPRKPFPTKPDPTKPVPAKPDPTKPVPTQPVPTQPVPSWEDILEKPIQERKVKNPYLKKWTYGRACLNCDLTFASAPLLSAHSQSSGSRTMLTLKRVGERNRLLSCPACPCMFIAKEALDFHVAALHPNPEFPCADCSERFRADSDLEEHRSRVHVGDFGFERNGKLELSTDSIKIEIKEELSSWEVLGI